MPKLTLPSDQKLIPITALFPFLLIAFGLAWSILALFIFLPEFMTSTFGNLTGQHPLFFLCVYSPAIAAFSIIYYFRGLNGLAIFLSKFFRWRCSAGWYLFIVVGVPLVFYAGAFLKGSLSENFYPFDSIPDLFIALLLSAIKGPIEEFGWRGFALPLMQRNFTPFRASLILGTIWGVWHSPAFLLSGTQQSNWSFAPFLLGCIAISIIATALFNSSRGSIFLAAFLHFMLMNPIFPDAEPFDSYLLALIAVPIIWFNRKMMFTGVGSVVEIVPSTGNTHRPANTPV
ncbi:MAG: CPBP family intramembrane metalloprotease [Deltaproteobacteria bacterium]|jgi:membrane protease YdiL (CAAX protease family)|nr:CPBP family intramembrane metalloprotease [Deltaproteobacteria bacterium]